MNQHIFLPLIVLSVLIVWTFFHRRRRKPISCSLFTTRYWYCVLQIWKGGDLYQNFLLLFSAHHKLIRGIVLSHLMCCSCCFGQFIEIISIDEQKMLEILSYSRLYPKKWSENCEKVNGFQVNLRWDQKVLIPGVFQQLLHPLITHRIVILREGWKKGAQRDFFNYPAAYFWRFFFSRSTECQKIHGML